MCNNYKKLDETLTFNLPLAAIFMVFCYNKGPDNACDVKGAVH